MHPRQDGERPDIRISDRDREQVVDVLRAHTAEGRLTLDEFSDRVGQVYAARTRGDLDDLTSDLPVPRHGGAPAPPPAPAPPALPAPAGGRTRWVVGVMSGVTRRGRWDPGDGVNVFAMMGACTLDFRDVVFPGPELAVTAVAFMGGVEIIVPEGMHVEFTDIAFMGAAECKVPASTGEGPVLRVKAIAFMGGVEVKAKPPRDQRRGARRERPRPRSGEPGRRSGSAGAPAARPVTAPASANGRRTGVASGTVTILFTDIEDFTGLTERIGDEQARALVQEHAELIRHEVAECEGLEVSTSGDGFMVAFSSARQAVRCAVLIQRALANRNLTAEVPLHVRMGLHSGDAVHDAEDFFGMAVNVASRIASLAAGDEILVSAITRQLAGNMGDVRFEDARTVELRGVTAVHEVHRVDWAGADTTT